MYRMQFLRSTAVAAVGAAVLAQTALAGGEPKNELPFTRPVVVARATQATSSATQTSPEIRGEPKNELPFTRPVVTQPATVVIQSSNGFRWTDGAIGLAAGIGVALSGAAVVGLTRRSPHAAN
jgi:hypothetical protein